jgi:hypothetical protein
MVASKDVMRMATLCELGMRCPVPCAGNFVYVRNKVNGEEYFAYWAPHHVQFVAADEGTGHWMDGELPGKAPQ